MRIIGNLIRSVMIKSSLKKIIGVSLVGERLMEVLNAIVHEKGSIEGGSSGVRMAAVMVFACVPLCDICAVKKHIG